MSQKYTFDVFEQLWTHDESMTFTSEPTSHRLIITLDDNETSITITNPDGTLYASGKLSPDEFAQSHSGWRFPLPHATRNYFCDVGGALFAGGGVRIYGNQCAIIVYGSGRQYLSGLKGILTQYRESLLHNCLRFFFPVSK